MHPEDLMRRAVALAENARRLAPPNPWVGCVVVARSGELFEGWTQSPGNAHAEVVALATAGPAALGSTLYTTLEPCAHHGRTPPCVDAVLASGVARVVVGIEDPDPRVRGAGLRRLEAAGVDVVRDVCAEAVAVQLAPYLRQRALGRPSVHAFAAGTSAPALLPGDALLVGEQATVQWDVGTEQLVLSPGDRLLPLTRAGVFRAFVEEGTALHHHFRDAGQLEP